MEKETKEEKLRRGTFRRDRDTDGLAYEPMGALPEPPIELNTEAADYYYRVANALFDMGVLAEIHLIDIEIAATWYSVMKVAQRDLRDGNVVQTAQSGYSNISAFISVLEKATANLHRFADKYGLNLISVSKVKTQTKKKANPLLDD